MLSTACTPGAMSQSCEALWLLESQAIKLSTDEELNQHLVTSLCDMISVMFVPENSWIEPATLPFLSPPEPKPQKLNPRDVPIISRCHVTFCHNDIEFMTSPDLRRLARCKLPILLLQLLHQVLQTAKQDHHTLTAETTVTLGQYKQAVQWACQQVTSRASGQAAGPV